MRTINFPTVSGNAGSQNLNADAINVSFVRAGKQGATVQTLNPETTVAQALQNLGWDSSSSTIQALKNNTLEAGITLNSRLTPGNWLITVSPKIAGGCL